MSVLSPFDAFIEHNGFAILDGGLATELESLGHDLNHLLWSGKILKDYPESILKVHESYLKAGADCITTASYQLSFRGGSAAGLKREEVLLLLHDSIKIAQNARFRYMESEEFIKSLRPLPVIAGSIGPYGAFLADGSEYSGIYDISESDLLGFHKERFHIFNSSEVDLLLCETIPSIQEARILNYLISTKESKPACVSFSCRDGFNISDGTPIQVCADIFRENPNVIAIGVNCTFPRHVTSLINEIRKSNTQIPIMVYPNSGENYDPVLKGWSGESEIDEFVDMAVNWFETGAAILGGCCRTSPAHISAIRSKLLELNGSRN